MTEFGARDPRDADQEERGPVVKDNRKIDPITGRLRSPFGASRSPFPGAGAADGNGLDPSDPRNAGQPIAVHGVDPVISVELEEARQQAAERTADLQRVTAEYANYRKRVDRDREQVVQAAKGSVLIDMLPLLDDLDRAEAHGDLTGSFKAVADKLSGVLTKLGLNRVGAEGEPFDPAWHEAVQFGTSSEVSEPTVTAVFRPGYRLGDRLVRPAVVVVTGPEHDAGGPSAVPAAGDAGADPVADRPADATGGAPPAE